MLAALVAAAAPATAPSERRGLIVRGVESDPFDHTYTAALLMEPPGNKKEATLRDLQCGGTLVAPDVIVSAAHCFLKKASSKGGYVLTGWRVALHRHDLSEGDDEHDECSATIPLAKACTPSVNRYPPHTTDAAV